MLSCQRAAYLPRSAGELQHFSAFLRDASCSHPGCVPPAVHGGPGSKGWLMLFSSCFGGSLALLGLMARSKAGLLEQVGVPCFASHSLPLFLFVVLLEGEAPLDPCTPRRFPLLFSHLSLAAVMLTSLLTRQNEFFITVPMKSALETLHLHSIPNSSLPKQLLLPQRGQELHNPSFFPRTQRAGP